MLHLCILCYILISRLYKHVIQHVYIVSELMGEGVSFTFNKFLNIYAEHTCYEFVTDEYNVIPSPGPSHTFLHY